MPWCSGAGAARRRCLGEEEAPGREPGEEEVVGDGKELLGEEEVLGDGEELLGDGMARI